ncbi:MAG: chemotaxis protein CheB [Proteobacteria bacterium]|nr:MAG: chemotaxis protein CheB [Pseudomonadota bacterium]
MPLKDIIVIGSSAGGVEALRRICSRLPADFPASVFVAQHLAPSGRSILPEILSRSGPLHAEVPADGEAIQQRRIYVAPPDHHLLVRSGVVLVRRGPHENRTRPSADALFRSAAVAYGARVIGVVLTGLLDDGTAGLIAIKAAGGTSIVQDPADAEWPSMPRNALQRDHVDSSLPLDAIPALLEKLVTEEAGPSIPLPEEFDNEDRIAAREMAVLSEKLDLATPGDFSPYSCPDCGGVLNRLETGEDLRFRCQVGHGFTPLGLVDAQNDGIEHALAVAVRTHKERIRLFDQMSQSAQARGMLHATKRWRHATDEAAQMISVLEDAMARLRRVSTDA